MSSSSSEPDEETGLMAAAPPPPTSDITRLLHAIHTALTLNKSTTIKLFFVFWFANNLLTDLRDQLFGISSVSLWMLLSSVVGIVCVVLFWGVVVHTEQVLYARLVSWKPDYSPGRWFRSEVMGVVDERIEITSNIPPRMPVAATQAPPQPLHQLKTGGVLCMKPTQTRTNAAAAAVVAKAKPPALFGASRPHPQI